MDTATTVHAGREFLRTTAGESLVAQRLQDLEEIEKTFVALELGRFSDFVMEAYAQELRQRSLSILIDLIG